MKMTAKRDADGNTVDASGISRDVVERRRAETALEAERQRSERYLNTAEVILIALDTKARVTLLNRKGCQVLGYEEGELIGRDWFRACLRPADYESVLSVYRQIIAGELEPFEYHENCILTKQGQERRIAWHNAVIRDEKGRIVGTFSSGEDITERRQAEEDRRQMEARMLQGQKMESLGMLAGGIAHDFNNLLVGILGNIDLALADLPPVSPLREPLLDAEKAGRSAAELCRQMLAYAGKGRLVVRPINLREVVEDVVRMLEVTIPKNAAFRCSFAQDIPAVEADATQIRQVLMNLIINAAEAIGDRGGAISIAIAAIEVDREYLSGMQVGDDIPEGRYVLLEVTDTGCGMDAATKARIFEPFFSRKFAGRGLGLSAVLGIVRGHKGAIRVDSEPEKGTRFRILFPAADRPSERLAEAANTEGWRGSGTVLLADDEACVRTVGRRMLERMGYRAMLASDGIEAVELFRRAEAGGEERIVCAILDLTMPRMSGEDAFREIRRLRGDIPVILSSGYSGQHATRRFAGDGLSGFVQKPYRFDEMAAAMRSAIAAPGAV